MALPKIDVGQAYTIVGSKQPVTIADVKQGEVFLLSQGGGQQFAVVKASSDANESGLEVAGTTLDGKTQINKIILASDVDKLYKLDGMGGRKRKSRKLRKTRKTRKTRSRK